VSPDPVGPEAMVGAVSAAARRGDLHHAARLADAAEVLIAEGSPQATTLANVRGGIAFELGDLERAEACFERVIRQATDRGEAILAAKAATNLGSIAHLRGKGVLAASLYASALEAYERQGDEVGVARVEHNLGIVERELGALDRAGIHSDRAVAAARRTRDSGLMALTLAGAAEVAVEREDIEAAQRQLGAARALAEIAEDSLGLVEVTRVEARLALRRQRDLDALREARRAYRQARRMGCLQLSGESAALAAQASRRLSRTRLADRFRTLAEECFRGLGAPIALRRLELV
jgi:tetratricopeptide (TPR) repeat protein